MQSEWLTRAVNPCLLNSKWLDLPLQRDSHAAQKVADRVIPRRICCDDRVKSQVFSRVAERPVFDERALKRLIENNQYVTHAVMERLVEAHQRGFW